MKTKFASVAFCPLARSLRGAKRLILPLSALFVLAVSCLSFCACAYSPADTGLWYLSTVVENGVEYSAGLEENYNGTLLSSDYLVFKFEKDGAVTITDLSGGVRQGTFTEKRGGKDSEIYVTLEDGGTFTGHCGKYMFDGVWYEFYLTDGSVTYYLTEKNHTPKENAAEMFLKDAYPEIAALNASDITKIDITGIASLTERDDIQKFINDFGTANFVQRITHGYHTEFYSYTITVRADKEYGLNVRAGSDYKRLDIFFEDCYYELRGALSELLLNYLQAAEQAL